MHVKSTVHGQEATLRGAEMVSYRGSASIRVERIEIL